MTRQEREACARSAMSLTMQAIRRPCSLLVRMYSSRVLLPAPRKPERIVTGRRSSAPFAPSSECVEEGGLAVGEPDEVEVDEADDMLEGSSRKRARRTKSTRCWS